MRQPVERRLVAILGTGPAPERHPDPNVTLLSDLGPWCARLNSVHHLGNAQTFVERWSAGLRAERDLNTSIPSVGVSDRENLDVASASPIRDDIIPDNEPARCRAAGRARRNWEIGKAVARRVRGPVKNDLLPPDCARRERPLFPQLQQPRVANRRRV